MMNKNKLTKTLLLLLLALSVFNFDYKSVYAGWDVVDSGGDYSSGDENNESDGTGGGGGSNSGHPSYGSKCDRVSCKVSLSYEKSASAEVEVKDIYGNIISTDVFESPISKEFLAGTYVMLKVYEKQSFISKASYSVSAKRQRWICMYYDQYQVNYCAGPVNANGTCPSGSQSSYTAEKLISVKEEDCSCSGSADKVVPVWKGWKDVTSEYISSCASKAVPRKISLTPTYEASYRDSNDIDAKEDTGTATTVKGRNCDDPVKGKTPGKNTNDGYSATNTLSGSCSVTYDRKATICINAKTSDVRYLDGQTNGKCNEDEYKVTQDKDGYWKYFIPLDANSAEDFSFNLNSSGNKQSKGICRNIKSKYSYWRNIIKMNSDGTCTFQTKVTIPIKQRFYNELENGKNFKGFNFYYKPIDIENPFPNGLTNTSIWYDWNESKVKDPDISKSYQEVTYIGFTSGNENLIRQYNKMQENEYTNWQKMNVNGQSSYINKNENIIDRRVDKDSFYALGCGPINSTSDVNNVFYQKECDIS